LVSSPSDGDVISPKGSLSIAWRPEQLYFMRGFNDAPNGRMMEVENVTIQVLGTTSFDYDPDTCFGENHTGLCVETTTLTPGGGIGTPNSGFFAFDLSTNTNGDGHLLPWVGSSWEGRYDRLRVKVIASNHWFTWGYNRGWFTLGDGTAADPFCDPISPISTNARTHRLLEYAAVPAATTIHSQRDLSQVLVTGGFSLKASVNFDKVYITTFVSSDVWDLWEDTDTRFVVFRTLTIV
jgi:hypothetical protein